MGQQIINKAYLFIAVFFLLFQGVSSAQTSVDNLTGEDKENFDKFRKLFTSGTPDEFYEYAQFYEEYLKSRGHMMLYYKLKNNEGFFALRHNQVFQAMEYAKQLDEEVRKNGAKDYFYLPTGLMGDVYYAAHNTLKAEKYFTQALSEVGNRDPKFTMRTYMSLSEMLMLKSPQRSLEWIERAIEMAQSTDNVEYTGLSLGMKSYIGFIQGDESLFLSVYDQYVGLRSMDNPLFNHRYDRVLEVAKLAFDGEYERAFRQIKMGNLSVDSSLVATCVFAMEGDIGKTFDAVKRHYVEMDSVYSQSLDTNYDQLASESNVLRSKEETLAEQRMAKTLTYWMLGMIIVFILLYFLERRRLIRKFSARNSEQGEIAAQAEETVMVKAEKVETEAEKSETMSEKSEGERAATEIHEEQKNEFQFIDGQNSDIQLNNLCRSTIRSISGKKDGVQMRFGSNVDNDFTLHTDSYRLTRILTLLLNNALKYTEKGFVEVRCNLSKENMLRISVTDTGKGIPEKERNRIFGTFVEVEDVKEDKGLGLPLCHRLASSIGAELELDSSYTDGTRFLLTFICDG